MVRRPPSSTRTDTHFPYTTRFRSVETPDQVADTIGLAMKYVPKENIIACTICGLAPLDRELAIAKLNALGAGARIARERRSEEHTSELQSLMRSSYAVFCLKKKTRH